MASVTLTKRLCDVILATALVLLLALPFGLLFGRGLALFIMSSFSTETVMPSNFFEVL